MNIRFNQEINMKLSSKITSIEIYNELSKKRQSSLDEIYTMARYPYISLVDFCKNLASYEVTRVKKIQDLNIFYFINTIKIICGLGSPSETAAFKRAINYEPLRSAVILGQMQMDSTEKFITFFTSAIRILMSPEDGGDQFFRNPINVGLVGSMPRDFLKSRKDIGNQWFKNFVNIKLDIIARICRAGNKEDIFSLMLMSVAYSLYYFAPYSYPVSDYLSENDNLHIVLNKFIDRIDQLKNN